MDEVEKRGDRIDVDRLSKELGVPVIPITARTGEGVEELMHTAHRQMHLGVTVEPDDLYDDYTHDIHHRMGELLHDYAYAAGLPAHWASIKLLEGDAIVEKALNIPPEVGKKLNALVAEYENSSDLGDRETFSGPPGHRYPYYPLNVLVAAVGNEGLPVPQIAGVLILRHQGVQLFPH